MLEDDLKNQLTIARNEINNLRQQVRNLQHVQRKDIDAITRALRDFRCEGCAQVAAPQQETKQQQQLSPSSPPPTLNQQIKQQNKKQQQDTTIVAHNNGDNRLLSRPIGVIRTAFPEKRAVPRQSSVGSRLRGVVELNSDVFTNPEHSLEGLSDFSHLWLIYHFHRNNAHPKAKVAPPRLGGERVGVFSTRSPHRPCPIGLSLVEIEKIEGATIGFYGTDMVDGTPVLDIKPYIPLYDAPRLGMETGRISVGPLENTDFYVSRQEPDGEEDELELYAAAVSNNTTTHSTQMTNDNDYDLVQFATLPAPPSAVRVPNWVAASHRLNVYFNERAEVQLRELQVQKQCIIDILETDPRSVYLRTKYGSQIFTFRLTEVTVTCKFDDKAGTVTVVQVRRNENVQDENETHDDGGGGAAAASETQTHAAPAAAAK